MNQAELLARLQEAFQNASDAIGEYLERSSSADRPAWDPSKIIWEDAQGAKGPYQKSEDVNNPEFKTMLKDLSAHGRKLRRDGWFYWVFENGVTVGRKKMGENKRTGQGPHRRMQQRLDAVKAAGERLDLKDQTVRD